MLSFIAQSFSDYVGLGVTAFLLTFVRLGTAMMLIPGPGDSFVPRNVRLLFAVSFAFLMTPVTTDFMPAQLPVGYKLYSLIGYEFVIGLLYGTLARIFMTALDVAGMIISMVSGLGSAQLFNPSLASQGSLLGAFFSITGVIVLFALNLHSILIMGMTETYQIFPVGMLPETASMAELISKAVATSFSIGVKIAAPFMVMTLMVYLGMGVISRLMPQIQVFLIALPLQIWMSLILIALALSSILLFWAQEFEEALVFFLTL